MNTSQTYISEKVRNSSNTVINPATDEGLEAIVTAIEREKVEILESIPILTQMENGEVATYDTNLQKVLGSVPLSDNGKLKTSMVSGDIQGQNFRLIGANSEARVDVTGFTTCSIQLTGTWAGTQTFEISSNGGDFIAVSGINSATNTIVYTVTGNGIIKFNVSGLKYIRVRFSAYTSGTCIANFNLSSGTQTQPLSQGATGILNTHDDFIPFIAPSQMYETGFELESQRRVAPTVNPTQPTSYVAPLFANTPQKFRRLRTQSAGSEMMPYAQEPNTNRMIISDPDGVRLLEQILIELTNIRSVLSGDGSISQ